MPLRLGLPKGIGLSMSAEFQAKDLSSVESVLMGNNEIKLPRGIVSMIHLHGPQMGAISCSARLEEEKVKSISSQAMELDWKKFHRWARTLAHHPGRPFNPNSRNPL